MRNRLHQFYLDRGIAAYDGFNCANLDDCQTYVPNMKLYKGSEAHIGQHYDTLRKVVVVSTDRGEGSEDVWGRSQEIEGLGADIDTSDLDPLMRGTLLLLKELLPDAPADDIWNYFAMTNSAKCCIRDKTMNSAPVQLYSSCAEHSWAEIVALDPQIIVTQGSLAQICLSGRGKTLGEKDSRKIVRKYCGPKCHQAIVDVNVKILEDCLEVVELSNHKDAIWLKTPNPSARGGIWQRFADYQLPIIALAARDWCDDKIV